MKIHAICCIILLGIGCTSKIEAVPQIDTTQLEFTDNRTEEQKTTKTVLFSPISVLGEEMINPKAISLFFSSLQTHKKNKDKINVIVDEFTMFDFYPKRLNQANSGDGILTNLIVKDLIKSKTDWSLVNKLNPPKDEDSVICLFKGKINGKSIMTIKSAIYRPSPFSFSILSTKEFKDAVVNSIDQAAQDSISQAYN